jgi:hypothetical protein
MAQQRKKDTDANVVGRLAERGEEAVSRLMDELGRSPRVTDALSRAMSAKGRLDSASRSALSSIGLAPADELKDLRKQLERLERRLTKLETGTTARTKRSETKKTPTAKKRTATRSTSKKTQKGPSPAPGRAIGGGTGRGAPGGPSS